MKATNGKAPTAAASTQLLTVTGIGGVAQAESENKLMVYSSPGQALGLTATDAKGAASGVRRVQPCIVVSASL